MIALSHQYHFSTIIPTEFVLDSIIVLLFLRNIKDGLFFL